MIFNFKKGKNMYIFMVKIMKRKVKLKLIDNYVDIHKILYKCKINYLFAKTEESLIFLETIITRLNRIKEEHENLFKSINMYDDAFILLKKDLEEGLKQTLIPNKLPQDKTFDETISQLEKTFSNLTSSIKKQTPTL